MGGIPSSARAPRGPAGGDVEVRSSRNDRGAADPRLQDPQRRNVPRGRRDARGVARLVDCLQRQTVEELDGHFRICVPTHEAHIALQCCLERRGRNDLDAVGQRRWRGGGLGLWRERRGIGRDRVNRERARNGDREREQPGGRRLRGGCARYRRDSPRLRIRVGRMHVRALARSGHRCSAIPVRRCEAAARGAGSGADPELRAAAGRDSS